MDIKLIALLLLLARVGSATFIFLVLRKQAQLMQYSITPALQSFRRVLFAISMIIFLGNFVPIFIDIVTILDNVERPQPRTIGIIYGFSNAITALIASILIWLLYRLAGRTAVTTQDDIAIALTKKQSGKVQ